MCNVHSFPNFCYYRQLKIQTFRVVGPKIELVEELEATLRKKQDEQAKSKAILDNLLLHLRKLELEYEEKTKLKEEFQRQAEHLKLKLERAHMLIDGLGKKRSLRQKISLSTMRIVDSIQKTKFYSPRWRKGSLERNRKTTRFGI